jgi:hypothetical protein
MQASTSSYARLREEAFDSSKAAAISQGRRTAVIVGGFLERWSKIRTDNSGYPSWFLIDLGYALQIREWERQDLINHIPIKLPSSNSLILSLVDKLRAAAACETDQPQPNAELPQQVLTAFLDHFNHTDSSELPGDFVVKLENQADLIDAMAQWLWKNRHSNA